MKGSKPTAAESRWMSAICEIGCIVCRNEGLGKTPASPHHLVEALHRLGHYFTIPLCSFHHQVPSNDGQWVTRHGPGPYTGKALFEETYGSEFRLLHQCQKITGLYPVPVPGFPVL